MIISEENTVNPPIQPRVLFSKLDFEGRILLSEIKALQRKGLYLRVGIIQGRVLLKDLR